MQNIEDILSRLGKAEWFTVLDLEKGFFQIPLSPEDREKTAFSTHKGLFQFTVMPFGLRNAPATFQRFMDAVLGDAARKWAEPFFDDVIIYSETMKDHLEHLEDVFGRLDRAGLRINGDKVQLCRQRLKFLGHVIMPGMVKPDLKKINAIANFPEPCSKRAVQQFLGLSGF